MATILDPLTIAFVVFGCIGLIILAVIYFLLSRCLYQDTRRTRRTRILTAHTLHLITLDTRIGCSDGYCYLQMFKTGYHDHICNILGPYPTIRTLLAIPPSYRTKRRGVMEFVRDKFAHYQEDKHGDLVWELLDYALTKIDEVGNSTYTRIANPFPNGYLYLRLIHPGARPLVELFFGPNPLITDFASTPEFCRLDIRGCIWEPAPNSLRFNHVRTGCDGWKQVAQWAEERPEARIGM
jgi:hypothetical protein